MIMMIRIQMTDGANTDIEPGDTWFVYVELSKEYAICRYGDIYSKVNDVKDWLEFGTP